MARKRAAAQARARRGPVSARPEPLDLSGVRSELESAMRARIHDGSIDGSTSRARQNAVFDSANMSPPTPSVPTASRSKDRTGACPTELFMFDVAL